MAIDETVLAPVKRKLVVIIVNVEINTCAYTAPKLIGDVMVDRALPWNVLENIVMVELGGMRPSNSIGAKNVHLEIESVITPEIDGEPRTNNPRFVPAMNVQLRKVKVMVDPAAIPTKSTDTLRLLNVVATPLIRNVR